MNMKNNLNIAELLKDCPKGMELDCTICDNVYLDEVTQYMIKCFIKNNNAYPTIYFHHDGTYLSNQNAKCVIFPKGKTTWEGFIPPFKDGDIIYLKSKNGGVGLISIYKNESSSLVYDHCCVSIDTGVFYIDNGRASICKNDISISRHATEEEKQKLFDAIKENGYKWNPETKILKKLVEPKFKVGDRIRSKINQVVYTIIDIRSDVYSVHTGTDKFCYQIPFSLEKDYELVPNKFDINTLKPFDKVLVRTDKFTPIWTIDFYDGYQPNVGGGFTPFGVTSGRYFQQCIPYKGNEYLRGTTDDCKDFYKTWK